MAALFRQLVFPNCGRNYASVIVFEDLSNLEIIPASLVIAEVTVNIAVEHSFMLFEVKLEYFRWRFKIDFSLEPQKI